MSLRNLSELVYVGYDADLAGKLKLVDVRGSVVDPVLPIKLELRDQLDIVV